MNIFLRQMVKNIYLMGWNGLVLSNTQLEMP